MLEKSKLKIGIVGCGAIGSSLAEYIAKDSGSDTKLTGLFDIQLNKALALASKLKVPASVAAENLGELVKRSDLVIEAASSGSCWDIVKSALNGGKDAMIMSVGGVVGRFKELRALAKKNDSKVYIPSGAIAGIDALKGAGMGKIKSVILTTRKHPHSFSGIEYIKSKGIKLERIKKDTLLFSGSAKHAVKLFPQNINVAGILSIAGIGESRTLVKIIACPGLKKNVHEIEIISHAANIKTVAENILHPDNPKTSFLAVLSAIATLKQIVEPVRIGT